MAAKRQLLQATRSPTTGTTVLPEPLEIDITLAHKGKILLQQKVRMIPEMGCFIFASTAAVKKVRRR